MKTHMLSASALVLSSLTVGTLPVAAPIAVAQTATCDTSQLPNSNWSFEGPIEVGSRTEVTFDNIDQAGASGNVFADKTTTTFTTYECRAINPGGHPVSSRNYTFEEETSSATETHIKVCQNGSTTPLEGYTGSCPG
jgi:hypothetical protein